MESNEEFYFQDDPYFYPKLEIMEHDKKDKILNLLNDLFISKSKINLLYTKLNNEIENALDNNPDYNPKCLPMFNTFVDKFFTVKETGIFLGLDLGGTNLRISNLELNPQSLDEAQRRKINLENYDVPKKYRQSKASELFNYLGSCLKQFIDKYYPNNTAILPLGFTFSFGFEQLAINRGRSTQFGIATDLIDGIGMCPVEQFQASIDALKLPVKIVALANDSTATLIYGKFLDPETDVSLILGSGGNVAYIEKVERDKRLANVEHTLTGEYFIINSEIFLFGDFGKMDFIKSRYDYELDVKSLIPNSYTFEKMIGGAFLGEIFRLALVDLIQNDLLLKGKFTDKIVTPEIIQTFKLSEIDKELLELKNSYLNINSLLLDTLGYELEDIKDDDRLIIAFVCQLITIRCGILCAIVLAPFVNKLERQEVKICADGSLFEKHPKMLKLIKSYLNKLTPIKENKLFLGKNGSCIGASILASIFA